MDAATQQAAAAAATVPPPPPAPVPTSAAEDAAAETGEAIDTFSLYVPTALPACLMAALMPAPPASTVFVETTTSPSNTEMHGAVDLTEPTDTTSTEVIEIMDSSCSSFEDGAGRSNGLSAPSASAAAALSPFNKGEMINNDIHQRLQEDVLHHGSKNGDLNNEDALAEFEKLAISSHTSPACESALLASVSAPRASNKSARCLVDLAKSKALSPLQLEGATLAITRHNRLLYDTTTTSAEQQQQQQQPRSMIRAGFFIGDGAGIGKGRQIAAVLKDSMCRGRTRHLWISVSRELSVDAKRDLVDVFCHVPVHDGSDLLDQTSGKGKGLGAGGGLGKGVLFVTYSLLVSGQGRRMEEIIQWLAGDGKNNKNESSSSSAKVPNNKSSCQLAEEQSFDGVIIFDEAHKAKNLNADTHTARLVIKLQQRLPRARVLYCSATGVSDIQHMVYANRLGLWGAGSALYPNFESFQHALSNRGVGSLEMLALEMKQMGTFVARTLSWEGAAFETMEIPLEPNLVASYDAATQWWLNIQKEIQAVLKFLDVPPPKPLWRAYWSAHQRFFREMAICAKIPSVAQESLKYLEEGFAIVIGLQSTGESSTQCALEELGEQILLEGGQQENRVVNDKIDFEDILLPSLISTARSIMTNFVKNHFPVAMPPEEPPKVPPMPPTGFANEAEQSAYLRLQAEAERIKSQPPPLPIPELLEARQRVFETIRALDLPPNPLDDLIDRLGGESQVAELTGRSGRIIRTKDMHNFHYVKRVGAQSNQKTFGLSMPKNSEDFDKLNLVEKRKFMDGRKSVAIISDAASTGISLHSAEGSGAADKRRVHFTIELPWAADKAIQQLGRTHRSGQKSAPIYKMVVTDLGGERRFGAAVAKRMASLGALTKGDRRAATGSDLSEFDMDSVYGRRAVNRVYQCLRDVDPPTTAPSRHSNVILEDYVKNAPDDDEEVAQVRMQDNMAQQNYALLVAQRALVDVGLTANDSSKKNSDVKLFLNRIAGLPVLQQKLVFSLFMSTLDDVVSDAKATGEFEGSVEDVKATRVELDGEPEVIAVDRRSGAATTLTRLKLDRGISLEMVAGTSLECAVASSADKGSSVLVAESGFYVSKRKIAGRDYILFAKRKVEPGDSESKVGNTYDPLGFMVITRPNTGKNPCEIASKDLRIKYRLVLSAQQLKESMKETEESTADDTECTAEQAAVWLRSRYPHVAKLWDDAYLDSDMFEYNASLAPRRSRLGLITGAVLHVLPALEKAVIARRQAERALRVARVELTDDTSQRIVGIRFPLDDDPLEKLRTILKTISEARKGFADATLFEDESFCPVNDRSTTWATSERKTMRSFFTASSSSSLSGSKRKERPSPDLIPFSPAAQSLKPSHNNEERNKTKSRTKASKPIKKSTSSIKSFFAKK